MGVEEEITRIPQVETQGTGVSVWFQESTWDPRGCVGPRAAFVPGAAGPSSSYSVLSAWKSLGPRMYLDFLPGD